MEALNLKMALDVHSLTKVSWRPFLQGMLLMVPDSCDSLNLEQIDKAQCTRQRQSSVQDFNNFFSFSGAKTI